MKSRVRVIGVALLAMLIGMMALAIAVLAQGPPTPHTIAGQEQCLMCHTTPTLPADHEGRPEASCAFCHPESEDAEPVAESPATPHPIAGREQCLLCHAYNTLPANHEGRDEAGCATCHPAAEPAAPSDEVPTTPHPIAGREQCLLCHAYNTLPANHEGRDEAGCATCHPAAGTAPPSGPMDDQGCLSCHSQPGQTFTFPACEESLSLTVDGETLAASVHGKAGVTCTDCHTGITGYPHPPVTAEDCRAFTIERSEACANCHSDITEAQHDSIHYELLAEGDPNAPTCVDCHGSHSITPPDEPRHKLSLTCGSEGCHASILLAYEESVHGSVIAREEDNPYVPVCEDCHGAHQMPDPRTGEFHEASPELCATCHADESIVAQFGLSTDVYQDYRDGIHAQLHENNPNLKTPVCTDCHGVHDVKSLRDNPLLDSQICADCHQTVYDKYAQSVHGNALICDACMDVPGCTYCHSSHKMPNPNTPQFRIGEPDLCASCHADAALMAKYGLSPDVYVTYTQDFHGMTVELYKTKWPEGSIYCYEAVCTDCHGIHEIRSADDPKSTVHPDNLNQACRQCHPGAPAQFASAWTGHLKVTQERHPLTYYVQLFYKILIPLVIGAMVLFVLTDIGRRAINHFKRGKAS